MEISEVECNVLILLFNFFIYISKPPAGGSPAGGLRIDVAFDNGY
ncbi:hypothetical protein [Porphyromonas pogonae]|nr:hypothetical protein [Porphyromonas pogonae]